MRLHHLALGAHDVEEIATFYRTFFELTELTRHHDQAGDLRSIWLSMGDAVLMVEKTVAPIRSVHGVGAGPFLLAFAVSREKRIEAEDALIEAGHPIEARTEHSSYTRDPEGNRVALSHYPV